MTLKVCFRRRGGGGSIWYSLLLYKYGSNSNGWNVNPIVNSRVSLIWKQIIDICSIFDPHMYLVLGNDRKFQFVKDAWWGDSLLLSSYPRLFLMFSHKEGSIVDSIVSSLIGNISWNLPFFRNLLDFEYKSVGSPYNQFVFPLPFLIGLDGPLNLLTPTQ